MDAGDYAPGCLSISERNQYLVEHYIVEHLEAGLAESLGKTTGMAAIALHQISYAGAAQRTQRGPHLHAARPPGKLWGVIRGIAFHPRCGQILSSDSHGGAQGVGIAHEGQPTIIRHIQPLVRVGGQ